MSSVGRLALGIAGAIIAAPLGFAALGFSIGSMVGGMIFAPTVKVEGPRLGDTSVSASSMGKVISEQYGVTRSGGNIIWSAGLKEVKKKKKQRGKGGGGQETTTYHYYCSFAIAFGRGRAQRVRRMWADGKLIYDTTGDGETNNQKYRFRFKNGSPNQRPDPLVAESVNRRLAGMPDVNKGNQKQATYTTMDDLIEKAEAGTGARDALYAAALKQRRSKAENGGGVPDYRFTPGYRNLTYIVFDDMPLEDFGNRIPNITAEIVWGDAGYNWEGSGADEPAQIAVRTIPTPEPVKGGLLHLLGNLFANGFDALTDPDYDHTIGSGLRGLRGVNYSTNKVVVADGRTLSRFELQTRTAEKSNNLSRVTGDAGKVILAAYDGHQASLLDFFSIWLGVKVKTISDIYCITDAGQVVGAAVVDPIGEDPATILFIAGETSLEITDAEVVTELPECMMPLPFTWQLTDSGNTYFAAMYGDTVHFSRRKGLNKFEEDTLQLPANVKDVPATSTGPLVFAGEENNYAVGLVTTRNSASTLGVYRVTAANNYARHQITSTWAASHLGESGIELLSELSAEIDNPWGQAISHVPVIRTDISSEYTYIIAALENDTTGVAAFDASLNLVYAFTADALPPPIHSGQSGHRSSVYELSYITPDGKVVFLDLSEGTASVIDIPGDPANYHAEAQLYVDPLRAVFGFKDSGAALYYLAREDGTLFELASTVPDVITAICERSGMDSDEFDVSQLTRSPVFGYSIARQTSARQALEVLTQAYFVNAIESDWKAKFTDQQVESIRTIPEARLGTTSGPTGDVNFVESRTPEYALPARIDVNFSDPARDYQTSTATRSRISEPVPSMYSRATNNVELPLSLKEAMAESIAERMLFQSWMSRDGSQTSFDWTHVDLDPGDVFSVKFKGGRVITDRMAKATLGANFVTEISSARASDPVFEPSGLTSLSSSAVPQKGLSSPVPSKMFVFDIPLLYDYHATGGSALRYYMAVGGWSPEWRGAGAYLSWDTATYQAVDAFETDVTWGQLISSLPAPRALWSTDTENFVAVALPEDKGDIVSVTREEILNGANRALIWNPESGIAEIIQFQNAELTEDGKTIVLTKLLRGLRGTEYAVDKHSAGAYFILLEDETVRSGLMEISRINQTANFKGVSVGEVITGVAPQPMMVKGRSIMPWAPSRVNVTRSDTFGATFSWNRRVRIGGEWNMVTGIEELPLVEDSEFYEFYLIKDPETFNPDDPTTYFTKTVSETQASIKTPDMLAEYGLTVNDTFHFALYQVSPQIGRGFPTIGTLVP